MKIFVKAKTGQRLAGVEKISANTFVVKVKELPQKGLANEAIVKALAEYLGVARSQIRLLSGHTHRQKLFEIPKRS